MEEGARPGSTRRKREFLALALVAAVALLAWLWVRGERSPPKHATPRTFRVTVVSSEGDVPVEGASVRLHRQWLGGISSPATATLTATTGADGTVAFDLGTDWFPSSGMVRKRGFIVQRAGIAGTYAMSIRLEPGIPLRGRVVYADTGAPAPGTIVQPWVETRLGRDHSADVRQTADVDGRFEFAGVPVGRAVRVLAARPGYRTVESLVTRHHEGGPDVELVLGEGGVLEGTVFDVGGRPLPGASMYLTSSWRDPSYRLDSEDSQFESISDMEFPNTRTDAAGRYEFKGVQITTDGERQSVHVVAYDGPGRVARSDAATFARNGERLLRDVRFRSTRPGSGSITVRLSTPISVPWGVFVTVNPRGSRDPARQKWLGGDEGTAVFADAESGTYDVSVRAGRTDFLERIGFRRWSRSLRLADDENAVVAFEVAVDGAPRVEGITVGPDGQPEPHVPLVLDTGEMEVGVMSGDDGRFAFHGLPAEARSLRVSEDHLNPFRDVQTFADLRVEDVVPDGAPLRLVVLRCGRITGRLQPVPKPDLRDPIRTRDEVRVHIGTKHDRPDAELAVEEDGRFSVQSSDVGVPLTIDLRVDGFAPVIVENAVVPPGGALDLGEIQLDKGLTFEGRLLDTEGRPLAAASLHVVDLWREVLPLATDPDGVFRITAMPRRRVQIAIDATSATPDWLFDVDPAAAVGTFVVGTGATLRGRVLDATDAPAPGVSLMLFRAGARRDLSDQRHKIEAASDGGIVGRLQPGRYEVIHWAGDDSRKVDPSEIDVLDGENAPLVLRLR